MTPTVALAFVLACLLTSLPAIVAMAVVKHAGVSLSGPQGSPINDDPIYYRWDEGLPGSIVRLAQSLRVEFGQRPLMRSDAEGDWPLTDQRDRGDLRDLVIWEIDVGETD